MKQQHGRLDGSTFFIDVDEPIRENTTETEKVDVTTRWLQALGYPTMEEYTQKQQEIRRKEEEITAPIYRAYEVWKERLASAKNYEAWSQVVDAAPTIPDGLMLYISSEEKMGGAIRKVWYRRESAQRALPLFGNYFGKRYIECDPNQVQKRTVLDGLDSCILGGPVGTGKTHALAYLVDRIAKRNAMAGVKSGPESDFAFYRCSDVFSKLHKGEEIEDKDCRYMVIDDYGREYVEPWALSQFEELIEYRYGRDLKMLIACNLTKEQFLARPGFERIADRLLELCSWVTLTGSSKRRK